MRPSGSVITRSSIVLPLPKLQVERLAAQQVPRARHDVGRRDAAGLRAPDARRAHVDRVEHAHVGLNRRGAVAAGGAADVAVRVDEAGHHRLAGEIHRRGARGDRHLPCRADGDDLSVLTTSVPFSIAVPVTGRMRALVNAWACSARAIDDAPSAMTAHAVSARMRIDIRGDSSMGRIESMSPWVHRLPHRPMDLWTYGPRDHVGAGLQSCASPAARLQEMLGRLGFDLAALSLASLLTGVQAPAPPAAASVVHRVDRTQLMADVRELSSDQYQGRRTGTPGGLKARAWIREAFAAIGLKPAGPNGFAEPFAFTYQEDHAQGSSGRPVITDTRMPPTCWARCRARKPARGTSWSARTTIISGVRAMAHLPWRRRQRLRRCGAAGRGPLVRRAPAAPCDAVCRRSTPRSWGCGARRRFVASGLVPLADGRDRREPRHGVAQRAQRDLRGRHVSVAVAEADPAGRAAPLGA